MIDGETAGAITVSKTIDLNGTTWTGEYPAFSFTAEWVDSEGETHTVELSVQPTQEHVAAVSAQIIAPVGEDVVVTETVPAGWTAESAEQTVRVEKTVRRAAFDNTREAMQIEVTKEWVHYGEAPDELPNVTFELYRVDGEKQTKVARQTLAAGSNALSQSCRTAKTAMWSRKSCPTTTTTPTATPATSASRRSNLPTARLRS